MVVELAAFPGAGKSTIAALLRDRGVRTTVANAISRRNIAWAIVAQPASAGVCAAKLLPVFAARRSPLGTARLFPHRLVHDLAQNSGVELLEEGVVHSVWRSMLLDPRLESGNWRGIVACTAPLVVLDLPDALLHSRILTKETRGPVNEALAWADTSTWAAARRLYEEVVGEAERFRTVSRLDISDASVHEAADMVMDYL